MGPAGDWRSYRCPVCSHTDGVSLAGMEKAFIRCSHCDTPLDVRPRGPDGTTVTVALLKGRRRNSQTEPA